MVSGPAVGTAVVPGCGVALFPRRVRVADAGTVVDAASSLHWVRCVFLTLLSACLSCFPSPATSAALWSHTHLLDATDEHTKLSLLKQDSCTVENTKHPESTIYVPEATPALLLLPVLSVVLRCFTNLFPLPCMPGCGLYLVCGRGSITFSPSQTVCAWAERGVCGAASPSSCRTHPHSSCKCQRALFSQPDLQHVRGRELSVLRGFFSACQQTLARVPTPASGRQAASYLVRSLKLPGLGTPIRHVLSGHHTPRPDHHVLGACLHQPHGIVNQHPVLYRPLWPTTVREIGDLRPLPTD